MLWTIDDIAKALQVSDTTIRRLVGSRQIPFIRVGSCIRFPPEAIKEWVTKNTQIAHNSEGRGELCQNGVATGSIKGATEAESRRTGGFPTQTQAAKELGNLLELRVTKKPKPS